MLEAGSWRLEAGGWKLHAEGWMLEAGSGKLEAEAGRWVQLMFRTFPNGFWAQTKHLFNRTLTKMF